MKKPGILVGVLLLGLGVQAHAQKLSLCLSGGSFFPAERTYRDVYGNSVPLDFEVRLGVIKNLGLAAGVSYISDSGNAVNLSQGRDSYPVRFRRISFPLTAYLIFPLGDFSFFGGAGVSFHSYEEEWQTVPLSHKGNKTKPLAYGGVEYRILPRVGVRLALRYELIKAGSNPLRTDEVDLGGLTVLAGVSLRILP